MTDSKVSPAGGDPIDFAHLHSQTMGDRALAREVLDLFVGQSRAIVDRLSAREERSADVAHRLLGSARGIGAPEVARAAAALEAALRRGADGEAEFAALAVAVAAANAFIADRLAAS